MTINVVTPESVPMIANHVTYGFLRHDEKERAGVDLLPIPVLVESFYAPSQLVGRTLTHVCFIPAMVEVLN